MLMLDADTVLNKLPFTTLVDELAVMHLKPIGLIDEILTATEDDQENTNHFFIRTGWQPEEALGAKVTTIFPRNNQENRHPSIHAIYALFEGQYGRPIACLDGTALTYIKTAADSALGSQLLARPNPGSMLMIGAGEMALHVITAHCQIHPSIKQVYIWNRTAEKAKALSAGELAKRFPQINFQAVNSIEDYARKVDLISSAIATTTPLLKGDWLKPGVHVDLIGAYLPEMREADDTCMSRASIFVDARETTVAQIGELMIPLANGSIAENDIKADLSELCQQRHGGRQSPDEITLFKNGGGGHLDLMVARILYRHHQL